MKPYVIYLRYSTELYTNKKIIVYALNMIEALQQLSESDLDDVVKVETK